MPRNRGHWRKLHLREEGFFAMLPLYARSMAAELLKFCDDEGRIFLGQREPWEAVAKVAGADVGDRRLLRQHIPMLIANGHLRREGNYLTIKSQDDFIARTGTPTWSKSSYADVYARDSHRCRYCLATDGLSIDHIVPRIQGGSDDAENLVVACRSCNSRKGGRTPDQAGMVLLPAPAAVRCP